MAGDGDGRTWLPWLTGVQQRMEGIYGERAPGC